VIINLAVGPIVSLIAGVLILIVPRLLNYIVAIYLIIIGLIGVFGWSGTQIRQTATDGGPAAAVPVLAVVASSVPPGIDTGRLSRRREEQGAW
jgi:hypothetical protein